MSESEEETSYGHDADLDVLSTPLDNGDALTAVLTRRPRVKVPSLTLVLVAIVVASAGFVGGIVVGKHYGSSGSAASAFSRFAAGAGLPAGGAGANSGTSLGNPFGGLGSSTGGGVTATSISQTSLGG
jgi:hypothetical protein